MNRLLALLLMIFGVSSAFSQDATVNEDEVDEIIDNLLMEDQEVEQLFESLANFQFIYFSLNYTNDTYFSGRDIGIDQFNIRPQLTYMHSKGYFASVSGIYYSEFTPNLDYLVTSIGYGAHLDKKKNLRWYSSYSRYFYSNGVDNPYTNAISIGLGIKSKSRKIGTQLTGSYLFGENNSVQISSRSFVSFNLYKSKKLHLKFNPQLSFIAGQQTLELAQTSFQNGMLTTNYLESDVFDLINTQLNFPLQLRSTSFDFEIGYNFNLPSPLKYEGELKNTGYLNLFIAYMFDL